MKCPICNNDLVVKEVEGKKYLLCGNCKKIHDPATLIGNVNNHNNTAAESSPMALSICSMIFGIVGLLLSCFGIGIFPAVIGFILAIIALATHQSKGMAIAGLTTSLIGIIIAAVILITGTAINSALEEQGIVSSETDKKKSVKKDAGNTDDLSGTEQPESNSEPEQPESNSEPEQPADDNMIDFNMGKYIVKYTGHAIGSDYEGNPCLIVYYDFTNNSDEVTSAQMAAYIQVFQNGIQCESAIFMDENEAIRNYSTNVQPGVTINVGEAFKISDMSDVTIEASEAFSFDTTKDTMVIQLQ